MAISPTDELLARYKRDYHAGDLDEVLQNINQYGTDDRSKWFPQGREQEPPQAPSWDRTAFRDAWMGSGVQNVPDMQNWLKNTGWGQHVGVGGSKGDVMQLPSGENIDAVLAAGLGGNRGGPQWTGRGSWVGGYTPFAQQQMQPQQQGWGMQGGGQSWGMQGGQGMYGGQQGGGGQQGSSMYNDYQKMQNDQKLQMKNQVQNQQMGMHRQFQGGRAQRQQPQYYQNRQRQGMMQGQGQRQGLGPTQQPKYW